MIIKDTITIMPDYGMAPYAWLRRAGDRGRGVGGCIADSVGGFPDKYGVSEPLEKAFANWAIYFECNVDCIDASDFDWETFHARGRELTRRLKEEIGHKFNIRYVIPWEDPEREKQFNFCRWKIRYLIEKIEETMIRQRREQNRENEK